MENDRIMATVCLEEYEVRNKKQYEGYKEKLKRDYFKSKGKGKEWVACYHEPIKEVINENKLELHEIGALLILITYMQFKKDGLLMIDGKPMKISDIEKVIGKSNSQTKRIINKLANEGLILKRGNNRNREYYIDDKYHSIGKMKRSLKFTKLFKLETRNKTQEITLHEAGLLYKILPWFHYQSYYLCANPYESEPTKILHLNHMELSKRIGEDERTVNKHMKNLMEKGFIMQLRSSGAVNYIVHPDVMFRQENETPYTDVIRKQFKELSGIK